MGRVSEQTSIASVFASFVKIKISFFASFVKIKISVFGNFVI